MNEPIGGALPEEWVPFYRHAMSAGTLAADGNFAAVRAYLGELDEETLLSVAVVFADLAVNFASAMIEVARVRPDWDPAQDDKRAAWAGVAAAYWTLRDPYE